MGTTLDELVEQFIKENIIEYFAQKFPQSKSFCDTSVNGSYWSNYLRRFKESNWINVDRNIKNQLIKTYESSNTFMAFLEADESEQEMFILCEGETLVVVGTEGGHPYVLTPDFCYFNSDGSGPWSMNSDGKILDNMIKYMDEFCENKYH